MRKLFTIVILLLFSIPAWATHQRAAEITYLCKGDNIYEFTLTCYTYTPSLAGAQRDSLLVLWGDGFGDYMPRVVYESLGDNYTLNVYKMDHRFASTGSFVISMEDPDRNYGVVNVPNSVNIPMYIETELVISPFLGLNNSVQLLNPPVDRGCVGKPYYHNPGAYDRDGDSLSYSLVPCKGAGGEDIPGYFYPTSSSLFEIDAVTGQLRWENPVLQGEYNVAILIEEWRHGVKVGSVIRDMQILINACNNNVPDISCITDTCVVAGADLSFLISASDPDGDLVSLTVTGAPFQVNESPAILTPPSATELNPMMTFNWSTSCRHIRKTPYHVLVHAKDDAFPIALSNMKDINISVLGPKVESLVAETELNEAVLTWSAYTCPNATSLRVYRRMGASGYQPDPCETGVRPGYQLVAELSGHDATGFRDDNGGAGFNPGVEYCYRVVAAFPDGAESQPSDEVCVSFTTNKPLMTLVSNDSLNLEQGRVVVRWAKPLELDPGFTAPFTFTLRRNKDGEVTTVYTGVDSLFLDREANLPQATSLGYDVEMRDANQNLVGRSVAAEAVMLTGTAGDATTSLNWTEAVPWVIDSTEVFRTTDSIFEKVAVVQVMAFTDLNLSNEVSYRYYVRTFGHYSSPGLPCPLVNYSAVVELKPSSNEEPEPEQPVYELPNVFTPNNDGFNDVFVPMRITPELISSVKMHIFNRWGRTVFDTEEIFINWNGCVGGTGQPCAPGTYFYVCDVEMITPEGPVTQRLQGSIMIIK